MLHAGDGVAAVAAVTEQIADEALAKIVVEYEKLPVVLDPLAAMREDSPKVHAPNSNIYATKVIRKGDVEKGFAQSDHIFEGRFTTQMIEQVPMEPHAAIADWDANGRLTIWSALGRITLGRADMAAYPQAADEPYPCHRHIRRRQFRRQERNYPGTNPRAAVEEDRAAR